MSLITINLKLILVVFLIRPSFTSVARIQLLIYDFVYISHAIESPSFVP